MSFLHRVRLAFQGTFQADVSTVNNDVRHYDNATFQPSYQELQAPGHVENGWWNPTGSGAFRLLDCRVTGVWYADGTSTTDPAVDPIIGALVGGSSDRTSGKLVDVDPQWQLASELWGLDVRLIESAAADWFGGRYRPNSFRDLWFSRNVNAGGDRAASATFQSVLEGVSFGPDAAARSRALRELQAATAEQRLSIRLATFGYQDDVHQPGFTVGTLVGAIGPYLAGEPTSFVLGRRFTPASGFTSWAGMTWFTGALDEGSRTLFLDLSNALQITDSAGTPVDVGTIVVGALKNAALRENTPVSPDTFESFAVIPYQDPRWLQASGGVFAAELTEVQVAIARNSPLALVVGSEVNPGAVGMGPNIVGIRESDDGLLVGAEPVISRVDGGGSASVTVYASRYGIPLADTAIQIGQTGPSPQQGGGSPQNPNPPPAPIPDIGVPMDKVELPRQVTTDRTGAAALTIKTQDPKHPRGYLDGQLYLVDYRLPGQGNQARSAFDYAVIHVRDQFDVPADPTWSDVQPIFIQYGNLYPIMSKRLVNLADPADVKAHAKLLHFAFTRDISDPSYMPVTRDLSEGKRRTIIKWLEKLIATGDPGVAAMQAVAAGPVRAPAPPARPAAPAPAPSAEPPEGSKSRFARGLGRLSGKEKQS
ncbi:MAG TPA: hypothetical protein VNO30_29850 [Kofleriaceae bacterium]|nr:hypothetical protein [Kofleriaceae bacterium]